MEDEFIIEERDSGRVAVYEKVERKVELVVGSTKYHLMERDIPNIIDALSSYQKYKEQED